MSESTGTSADHASEKEQVSEDKLLKGPKDRVFTIKAILFGLAGVFIISPFASFSDVRLQQTLMIGNHFPTGAFFFFFCVTLFWNLAFGRTMLALSQKELAVALGMTLSACWVPTSGLYRYFHRMLILPWYYLPNNPSWEKFKILEYLPKKLFPDGMNVNDPLYDKVYSSFVKGVAKGKETVGFFDLPIQHWVEPVLVWWAPTLLLFAVCVMALALLVHRQWAHYEQIRYPLAQAATALFKKSKGNRVADIFSNKLFWWGFGPVLGLYMIHYMAQWQPEYFPSIGLSWNTHIWSIFPILGQSGGHWLWTGSLYFTIAGLTYFISSEIGLTMGLSQFLLAFVAAQFYLSTGKPLGSQDIQVFRGGAYIGYAVILVYTGRTYFWAVLKKAFGFGKPLEFEREAVFAARLFIVSFLGMMLMFVLMGLDWLIAFIFTFTLMLLMMVFTRIICETGIPFMQAYWFPSLIVKSMGAGAVGGGPMVMIYYLGAILQQDIRECLMPYVSTSYKVADDVQVKRKPLLYIMMGAVAVALVIGFSVSFYTYYNFGGMGDGYASVSVPTNITFGSTVKPFTDLSQTKLLVPAEKATGFSKLRFFSFDGKTWSFMSAGFFAVVLFSLLRFRIGKWPIHPILFLVWGTYPMGKTYWAFLIGWGVKELIVKFGGGEVYEKLKPIFIGAILGEIIAGGISIIFAFLYYFVFSDGLLPKALKILPT